MEKTFELWDKGSKERLEVTASKREGREWLALCPNHDDHHESLRISEEEKCYHCLACGFSGPFYNPSYPGNREESKIVATYDYRDEQGKLLFQVVRYYPKAFRQRQPDGKGGWVWNSKGVKRVLYKLAELIRAPDPVFILEGEKDADNLWKWGLTATTCPMGAKKWKDKYNKPLMGRQVILIPDNHKEGFEHMEQVGASLFGQVKQIKWLELPGLREKEDVSDWIAKRGTKEKLVELARQAPTFDPTRQVYQRQGCYLKRGKGPITNFLIVPKVRVQTDQGEFLKTDIIPEQGVHYRDIVFSPDSWISKQKFKKALGGILDLEYRGTEDDIQDIKGILASQDPRVKRGVKTAGLHKIEGEWIYVEEGLAWGRRGEYQQVVCLSGSPYKMRLLQEKPLTSSGLDDILSFLFDFNAEDVVYPLFGFCFACFVKERIFSSTGQNPILVCWGEKGSGKSATLRGIVKPLFGIKSAIENIGHPTKFGFARIISSSNLAPVLFDEHKPARTTQLQKDIISEMLRSVYNQRRLTRGTPDLGIVEFVYSAPIVVAGEMGISELAVKDRIIETCFSKKKIRGKENEFERLTRCRVVSLGKDFLLFTLSLEDSQLREMWQEQFETVDRDLEDRLRQNTAHARLGLAVFSKYLESKGKEAIHKDVLDLVDETQKVNILEESNKTIVDTIIEAFSVMAGEGTLEEGKHHRIDSKSGTLNLHVSAIYPLFKRWAWHHQWDGEVLDQSSFVKQLRAAKYCNDYRGVRFPDKTKKAYVLDFSQMEHLDIEEFTENCY